MMKPPLNMLAQLVLGNPLVEMTISAFPDPIRTEMQEIRRLILAGDLGLGTRERHEGVVDGDRVSGVGLCLGEVKSGQVRGVNVLRGRVSGGTVRAVNLLQGDVEGGDVSAVNVLVGALRGGTVRAVNLILGDIHGGTVTRTNLVVGDVHGGTLEAALLLGDIYGGEVTVGFHHGKRQLPKEAAGGAEKAPGTDPPDGKR